MATVTSVAHKPEEKVLVFEGVIPADMDDMELLDKGSTKGCSLIPVSCMASLNQPCCEVACHKTVLIGH